MLEHLEWYMPHWIYILLGSFGIVIAVIVIVLLCVSAYALLTNRGM